MKISLKFALALGMTAIINAPCVNAQNIGRTNPIGVAFARQGGEMPEGIFKFTSGGYEVYTLQCSDDPEMAHKASLFYGPDDVDKAKVDAMAPDGRVASAMNCFLVKNGNDYIMFDTGLGGGVRGKAVERLSLLEVQPGYIKAVYLTHTHGDHLGGLIDSNGKAVFVNATLYIPADEKDFMASKQPDFYAAIMSEYEGRIRWIKGGEIVDDVVCIDAPGHTPGHMVYRLGNLLFVGDIMHGASLQLVDPTICARYDSDPEQSIETRKAILDYAVTNSLTVLGAHVPANGVLF